MSSAAPHSSTAGTAAGSVKPRRYNFPAILTWQNPVKTGTVFIELLAVLVVWRFGNIFRTFLRLSYWAIGITGLVEYASRFLKGGAPGLVSSYKPSRYIDINQVSVEKYTSKAARAAVDTFSELKRLLDAEDLGLSLSVFIFTFFLYLLIGVLSVSTIAFVLVILSFTLPPLYLQYYKEVDQFVAVAGNHANEYYKQASTQINNKVGPHLDVAKKHLSTATSFVGLKNPYRGGYTSDPATSAKTTSADVPTSGIAKTAAPSVPKSPKLSVNSTGNSAAAPGSSPASSTPASSSPAPTGSSDKSTSSNPFTSHSDILAAAKEAVPEISEYKSVPTFTGNIDLTKNNTQDNKQDFQFN